MRRKLNGSFTVKTVDRKTISFEGPSTICMNGGGMSINVYPEVGLACGPKSVLDYFDDFYDCFKEYSCDLKSFDKALDCVLRGWGMLDWLYCAEGSKKKKEFKNECIERCSDLIILQNISNTWKHFTLWKGDLGKIVLSDTGTELVYEFKNEKRPLISVLTNVKCFFEQYDLKAKNNVVLKWK